MMVNIEMELMVVNNLAEHMLGGVKSVNLINEVKKILGAKLDLVEYVKQCGIHKKE